MDFDNSALKQLAISESGLIFDPTSGAIYTSNAVGLLILGALKDGMEPDEIRSRVVKQFDVDEQTAERDIYDFLSQMYSNGVIQHV
jgi:hypothetical protein